MSFPFRRPRLSPPRLTLERFAFGLFACAVVTHFVVGDGWQEHRAPSTAVTARAP